MYNDMVYNVYKIYEIELGYRACFVRAFAEKEKAIEYIKERKASFVVCRDGKIVLIYRDGKIENY